MNTKKLFITLILFVFLVVSGKTQIRYQLDKSRNETSWFVGFNAGITSYYGSLAVFNRDPLLKFKKESKFAFGINAGKSFNRFFGARAYFTRGGLQAENGELQMLYDAKLTSYGGQLIIQLASLIGRIDYVPDYAFYGILGFGMVNSKPQILTIPTEDDPISQPIDSMNYATQISSSDFNIGIGGSYEVFNQIDAYIELSYHLSFSEELDLFPGDGKDHFLHLSIGAIYRFGFAGHKKSSAFSRRRK